MSIFVVGNQRIILTGVLPIPVPLKFVPKCLIYNKSALVQVLSCILSCLVYYSTGLLEEYHVEVVVRVLRRSGGGGIKVPFNVRLEGCRRVQLHRSGWKTIPRADSSCGEGKFE